MRSARDPLASLPHKGLDWAHQKDLVMALQHLGKSSSHHTRPGGNLEKYRELTETTNLSNPSRGVGNGKHE